MPGGEREETPAKKVSIIVPVYNMQAYMEQCLDSCVGQTLADIEIVAVDDCSTDRSRDILARYAREYPDKVKPVYLDRNRGLGAVRNAALGRARGEYVLFVDSDDWIEPDACEALWTAARAEDADMAGADLYDFRDGEPDRLRRLGYVTSRLGPDRLDELARYVAGCGLFWTRMYRRSMIVENGLSFLEGIKFEDAYFNFLTALYARSVVKLDRAFYHYRDRPGSLSRVRKDPRAMYDRLTATRRLFETCRERGLYDLYRPVAELKYVSTMTSILYACVHKFETPAYEAMEEIRAGVREWAPDWKTTPYRRLIDPKDRALFRLAMASPRAFARAVQAIDGVNKLLGRA